MFVSCKRFLNDNKGHCYRFICAGSSSFWWWQSQAAFGKSEEGSISHSTFCFPWLPESAEGDDWGQSRTPADGKPAHWPKVKAITWEVKAVTVVHCYTCIEYRGIVKYSKWLNFHEFYWHPSSIYFSTEQIIKLDPYLLIFKVMYLRICKNWQYTKFLPYKFKWFNNSKSYSCGIMKALD